MANTDSGYVEVAFIGDLKKTLDKKLKPLTKDENVKRELATLYAEYANMYVPRSDKPEYEHHLQDYSIQTRGRIRWYKRTSKGEEIATALYEGPLKGKFHRRASGSTSIGSHKVHAKEGRWDYFVRNTKSTWSAFCRDAKVILKRYL